MRRRATLSLVFLFCSILALGAAPGLVAADAGAPGPFGEGITITSTQQPNAKSDELQAYEVGFDHGAYINEETALDTTREALIVKVLSGMFAFRVQGDVIVDPQDHDIQILVANPPIGVGDPVTMAHEFQPRATIANATCPGIQPTSAATPPVTPTRTLCLLNPALIATELGAPDGFVQLEPGFVVFLPPNSQCFFCNIVGKTGADTSAANTADQASLLVWGPTSGFSWQDKSQAGSGLPTATPSASSLHGAVGWTVMRNPGSPCH